MWLVETNSTHAAIECRYQCKVCDRTIVLNVAPEKERTSSSTLPGQTPPAEEVTLTNQSRCEVRFWPKADVPSAPHMSAFGGKADMAYCDAHAR